MLDPAGELIPYNKIVASVELIDEGIKRAEIITIVRVAHNNEFAFCGTNSLQQRVTITTSLNLNDPRP